MIAMRTAASNSLAVRTGWPQIAWTTVELCAANRHGHAATE
jgi:hypothetical protein